MSHVRGSRYSKNQLPPTVNEWRQHGYIQGMKNALSANEFNEWYKKTLAKFANENTNSGIAGKIAAETPYNSSGKIAANRVMLRSVNIPNGTRILHQSEPYYNYLQELYAKFPYLKDLHREYPATKATHLIHKFPKKQPLLTQPADRQVEKVATPYGGSRVSKNISRKRFTRRKRTARRKH